MILLRQKGNRFSSKHLTNFERMWQGELHLWYPTWITNMFSLDILYTRHGFGDRNVQFKVHHVALGSSIFFWTYIVYWFITISHFVCCIFPQLGSSFKRVLLIVSSCLPLLPPTTGTSRDQPLNRLTTHGFTKNGNNGLILHWGNPEIYP